MADNSFDLSPSDLDVLTRTMIGEDNTPEGQAAVGHVILNRLSSGGYGGTIPEIVFQPNAFEAWDARGQDLSQISPSSPAYQQAYSIAKQIASGSLPDETGGATNFINPSLQLSLGRKMPGWAQGTPSAIIGKQAYFANGQRQMTDDEIKSMWGGPSTNSEAPLNDDEINSMWRGPQGTGAVRTSNTYGALPSAQVFAHSGILANSTTDSMASSIAKNVATGAIKGVGDVVGTVGNLGNLSDYILDQAQSWITRKPLEQVRAARTNALAQLEASDPLLRTANALSPRNVLPSGPDVYNPILARTGEYVPQTEAGNALQTGIETAVGSLGPGAAGANALRFTPLATAVAMGALGRSVGDYTGNPLLGMAATTAVPTALRIGGSATNALAGRVDPETASLAETARNQYGIPITAPQMSSSPALRFAASVLNRLPFSGATAQNSLQQSALNEAVAAEMGVDANKITPSAISRAKSAAYSDYDAAKQNLGTLSVDPQFGQDLSTIYNNAHYNLEDPKAALVDKQLTNVLGKVDPASGTIDPDVYQSLTRKNGPLDNAINSRDSAISSYALGIKNAIEDLVGRNDPNLKALKDQADYRYFVAKSLEDGPENLISPTGDVNPLLLYRAVDRSSTPIGTLGQIGKKFMREPPSSGTAERENALSSFKSLGNLLMGSGSTMLGLHALGIPGMSPTEMLLAGASIPGSTMLTRGAGAALRSDWLTNNVIANSLGRGYQPSGASALLARSILPYALQSSSRNALAAQ